MSFILFMLGTILFGIITIICAIYAIICLKKESSPKSGILSIIISVCSLIVTLLASFQIKLPSPIILPLGEDEIFENIVIYLKAHLILTMKIFNLIFLDINLKLLQEITMKLYNIIIIIIIRILKQSLYLYQKQIWLNLLLSFRFQLIEI